MSPYIPQDKRVDFDLSMENIKNHIGISGISIGELNYILTSMCKLYLEAKGERYSTHGEILGTLIAVKDEWYRRKVTPYEDKKIEENGDVF